MILGIANILPFFPFQVAEVGFWDIILDFILLDAFDDLKSPPSSIYSVTKVGIIELVSLMLSNNLVPLVVPTVVPFWFFIVCVSRIRGCRKE